MMTSIEQLHAQIVKPSLAAVLLDSKELSTFLTLVMLPQLCTSSELFGPFQISSCAHRSVWDHHLARNPDKASAVRGLASQRRFLETPDLELNLNWGYAVAISASILEMKTDTPVLQLKEAQLAEIWFHHCLNGNHARSVKKCYLQRKSDLTRRPFAA